MKRYCPTDVLALIHCLRIVQIFVYSVKWTGGLQWGITAHKKFPLVACILMPAGYTDCMDCDAKKTSVLHTIAPVWDKDSRVLVLGTMPSPASRAAGFFYMHPQNRFWKVLPALFGESLQFANNSPDRDGAIRERRAFLLRHHIALWDVLAGCDIDGASDASIRNAVPNDFTALFSGAAIRAVFCTGKTAAALWQKHCAADYGMQCRCLPSTSPANARWSLEALQGEYAAVKAAADGVSGKAGATFP